MLGDKPVSTSVPVSDVNRAREFYEGKLGIKVLTDQTPDGSVVYECGEGTMFFTYPTPANAGKSPATTMAWQVDDIDAEVEELKNKGVTFEEYDMGELKTENGIARMGNAAAAWFKDPDGNILGIFSMPGM